MGSGARVARLPFPGAPGAQPGRSPRALCCCCACHSRKRAASSSVSMLIAPRAAGGAPGPRLRPASRAQVRLAGRQEGGITSGGRQGWAAQRTPQGRTGEHGEKKLMFPKIFAKYKLQILKILMQKNKRRHCLPPSPPSLFPPLMPPAPRPPGVPPTRKGFATRWRGGTDTHNKGRSRAAPGRRPRYYTGAAAKARTGAPARRAAASQEGRGGVPSGLAPPTIDGARTRGLGGGGRIPSPARALHFRFFSSPRPDGKP